MSTVVAPGAPRVDPDFASEVLADLYRYRRKRTAIAWLLWATVGWLGGHRFYAGRNVTGLMMMFTLGGGLVWWAVDAFLIGNLVRGHNDEQARRRDAGLPPLELSFMPPLSREVLERPPEWTARWGAQGAIPRARLLGDLFVLLITGVTLGFVAGTFGVVEAIVPVLLLIAVTAAGTSITRFRNVPLVNTLDRWSHRLRLFYYYSKPGTPLALFFRPITGVLLAPFRPYARAEVRLYLELGAVFTLLFLLEDILSALLADGLAALAPLSLFKLWVQEAVVNFVVIYAFATPIGAVLTLYVLVRPTHTLARVLSVLVLLAILVGVTL